jgi:integrase/recombinase XerD
MKIKDESFFRAIRNYLTIFLPKQKCYSDKTVTSYKTTINLFLDYLTEQKQLPLYRIGFNDLNKKNVTGYLGWLEQTRGNSASTCNQRLMALRSFAKYAGLNDIAQAAVHMELCGLPTKKPTPKIVEFLSETALEALLAQPNIRKLTELRNRFFMILMYDTAARCQEILDLRLKDFVLDAKAPFIYLTGKGNKTRAVPLMSATVRHFEHYISISHPQAPHGSGDYLFFTTIHGKRNQMSPDTVACFMKRYGQSARTTCSDMPENVHPHQLRHTRAIHLYRGGMPLSLLSEFLGHSDISTTQIYAYADTEMKRATIQKACPDDTCGEPLIWDDSDESTLRKLYGLM